MFRYGFGWDGEPAFLDRLPSLDMVGLDLLSDKRGWPEEKEEKQVKEIKVEKSLHPIPIFYADLSKQYRKLMNHTR